jgi:hypothetical protein
MPLAVSVVCSYFKRSKESVLYIDTVDLSVTSSHQDLLELLYFCQGRIKRFVGPRHFSSLGPFGDSTGIVETTVYSRLSGLMEGEGMHG